MFKGTKMTGLYIWGTKGKYILLFKDTDQTMMMHREGCVMSLLGQKGSMGLSFCVMDCGLLMKIGPVTESPLSLFLFKAYTVKLNHFMTSSFYYSDKDSLPSGYSYYIQIENTVKVVLFFFFLIGISSHQNLVELSNKYILNRR